MVKNIQIITLDAFNTQKDFCTLFQSIMLCSESGSDGDGSGGESGNDLDG